MSMGRGPCSPRKCSLVLTEKPMNITELKASSKEARSSTCHPRKKGSKEYYPISTIPFRPAVTVHLLLLTLKTSNAFFVVDTVLSSLPTLGSLWVFQYLNWKTDDVMLWWCNASISRLLGGMSEKRTTKEHESICFKTKLWLNQRSMSLSLLTGSQKNSVGKVRESSNSKTSSEYVGERRISWRCSWWLCRVSPSIKLDSVSQKVFPCIVSN